jgi:hypothetical protein
MYPGDSGHKFGTISGERPANVWGQGFGLAAGLLPGVGMADFMTRQTRCQNRFMAETSLPEVPERKSGHYNDGFLKAAIAPALKAMFRFAGAFRAGGTACPTFISIQTGRSNRGTLQATAQP